MFKRIRQWFAGLSGPGKARKLWVKALRSGKYEQGTGRLSSYDNHYCCLGVACEVYQRHVGGLAIEVHDYGRLYDEEALNLPSVVAKWLDITNCGKLREPIPKASDLEACNDKLHMTFAEIADVIQSGNLNTWEEAHA